MTSGTENTRQANELAEVSASYRAVSRETTPANLDRMVLRAAAEEAGKPLPGEWLVRWYRPLAFAATLVLCVALLLEFSDQQLLGVAGNSPVTQYESADKVTSPGAPVREDRNTVKRAPTRPNAAESMPVMSTVSDEAGAPGSGQSEAMTPDSDSSGEQSASFRDAADIAARQVQAVEASANAALKEMPEAGVSPAPDMPAAADNATIAVLEDLRCSGVQRENPGDWWQCINDMTAAGFTVEAQNELRNLKRTFPHFDTGQ